MALPFLGTEEIEDLLIYNVPSAGATPDSETIGALATSGLLADSHLDLGRALGIRSITIQFKYRFVSGINTRLYRNEAGGLQASGIPTTGGPLGPEWYNQPYSFPDHKPNGVDSPANLDPLTPPPALPADSVETLHDETITLTKDEFTLVNLNFRNAVANPSQLDPSDPAYDNSLSVLRAQVTAGLVIPRPVLFFGRPGASASPLTQGIFTLYPFWPKAITGETTDRRGDYADDSFWQLFVQVDDPTPKYEAVDQFGDPLPGIRLKDVETWAFELPHLATMHVNKQVGDITQTVRSGFAGGALARSDDVVLADPSTPVVDTDRIIYDATVDTLDTELDGGGNPVNPGTYGKWTSGPSGLVTFLDYDGTFREFKAQADYSFEI